MIHLHPQGGMHLTGRPAVGQGPHMLHMCWGPVAPHTGHRGRTDAPPAEVPQAASDVPGTTGLMCRMCHKRGQTGCAINTGCVALAIVSHGNVFTFLIGQHLSRFHLYASYRPARQAPDCLGHSGWGRTGARKHLTLGMVGCIRMDTLGWIH